MKFGRAFTSIGATLFLHLHQPPTIQAEDPFLILAVEGQERQHPSIAPKNVNVFGHKLRVRKLLPAGDNAPSTSMSLTGKIQDPCNHKPKTRSSNVADPVAVAHLKSIFEPVYNSKEYKESQENLRKIRQTEAQEAPMRNKDSEDILNSLAKTNNKHVR